MPRQITRRTAAKLAYAAPVVALSMSRSERVAAVSGGGCPPGQCLITIVVIDAITGEPLDFFLDVSGFEGFSGPDGHLTLCRGLSDFQIEAGGHQGVSGGRDFCTAAVHTFPLQPL